MFIHPALTWGFFLALVPLLIHLINLVRRKRVRWAAMDFLIQSYKKHQKWIWLQQLLLLLLRMLAVAVAVAMLAQWVARNQWLSLFGGQVTHHYVLVDDSFSMSERQGGVSAFDRAGQALSRIATQAMAQESPQKFTLLRFSRATGFRKDDASTAIGQLADLNAAVVDARFDETLEDTRRDFTVTQLSVSPRQACELLNELLRQSGDESNIIHLLSDFRQKEWGNPNELKQLLSEIDSSSEQIDFVNCASESQQPNLAITDVRPAEEVRAAGVPLFVNITVANFGADTARKIPLRVRTTYFDPQLMAAAEPGGLPGHPEEPPAVLIEEIPPGQTTTRQVQVFFPQAGQHIVQAILPDDVVQFDNRRWCVVPVEEQESVLAIDGDPQQRNAYYLSAAFQPGARATTGIRVDVQPASFLRDATEESLQNYRTIYLLDVPRLEDRAVETMEAFVRRGGGLAVFVGEQVQQAFYTGRLYRGGEGVLPLPIEREDLLPPELDENVPDFDVVDHPLFHLFLGERNPFIRLINIERYLRPPLSWSPASDSTVSVIARLRNRRPFAVEQRFGEGRVVVFLTTLAPVWNNWANDPSFVVVLLKLQSYLAAPMRTTDSRVVGTPIRVPTDPAVYRKDVVFVAPGPNPELPLIMQRAVSDANRAPLSPKDALGPATNENTAAPKTAAEPQFAWLPGISGDDANTSRSGVYELWRATSAGPMETQRFAFNVDPAESDLSQVGSSALLARLSPLEIRLRRADDYAFDLTEEAGFSRSTWLLLLLVGMLIMEQLLAYFASYHPAPVKGAVHA